MAYIDTYSGNRYTQKQIDTKLSKAKKELIERQKEEYGVNFCVKCKDDFYTFGIEPKNTLEYKTITCAHIKSVKACKESSEIEKIWSLENMVLECLHCHQKRDGLNTQFNFEK